MEAQARLNSILQGVDPGASPESDIRVEKLPDQDWNRQWAQSVRPIRIGRRIVICRAGSRWRCRHRTSRSCSIRSRHSARVITRRHGCYWNGLRISFTAANPCWMWGQGSAFWRWSRCGLGRPRPSGWNATLLRWIVHETMPQRTGLETISRSGAERWRRLTGKASCGRIWFSPISIARRCCFCAMNWRST